MTKKFIFYFVLLLFLSSFTLADFKVDKQVKITKTSIDNGVMTSTKYDGQFLYVNITQIETKGGYKWDMAICPLGAMQNITKYEYNPATNVWTNTGALQYSTLWGMNSSWCLNTFNQGYSLYSSGSGNKQIKLGISDIDNFDILTGTGTDRVNIQERQVVIYNDTKNYIICGFDDTSTGLPLGIDLWVNTSTLEYGGNDSQLGGKKNITAWCYSNMERFGKFSFNDGQKIYDIKTTKICNGINCSYRHANTSTEEFVYMDYYGNNTDPTIKLDYTYDLADLTLKSGMFDGDYYADFIMKWDITTIPEGATYLGADLCLYARAETGGSMGSTSSYYINNEVWTESSNAIDFNNMVSSKTNATTFNNNGDSMFAPAFCNNVSNIIRQARTNNNKNATIFVQYSVSDTYEEVADAGLEMGGPVSNDRWGYEDRENTGGTGVLPFLNISYIFNYYNVTINSPLNNTEWNTSSIVQFNYNLSGNITKARYCNVTASIPNGTYNGTIQNRDFETGDFTGWTEGDGNGFFICSGTNCRGGGVGTPAQGSYSASTMTDTEGFIGTLNSSLFYVVGDNITFQASGWTGSINLLDSQGNILLTTIPPLSDDWSTYTWDTTPYYSQQVKIKVIDEMSENAYGWIAVDDFKQKLANGTEVNTSIRYANYRNSSTSIVTNNNILSLDLLNNNYTWNIQCTNDEGIGISGSRNLAVNVGAGCSPSLLNTSWTYNYTVGCMINDTRNDSYYRIQYDANNCGGANTTFYTFIYNTTCDYCLPSILNTTEVIVANGCYINDTTNKTYSWHSYDSNTCYDITGLPSDAYSNITYSFNIYNETCNYCSYNVVNSTFTDWINTTCLNLTHMTQSRYMTEYDSNYSTCYAVTGLASDLWNSGLNNTYYEYNYTEDNSCIPSPFNLSSLDVSLCYDGIKNTDLPCIQLIKSDACNFTVSIYNSSEENIENLSVATFNSFYCGFLFNYTKDGQFYFNYSINEVQFLEVEVDIMVLAAIIILPIILGFFFLVGSATMNEKHSVLRIFLFLMSVIMFIVSMHFGTVAVIKYYDFPELQDTIGDTMYWLIIIFGVIITYFIIYGFYVMIHYAAQKRQEKLEY